MTIHEHETNLNLALQRNENLKKAAAARLAANREWNQKNRPKKKK